MTTQKLLDVSGPNWVPLVCLADSNGAAYSASSGGSGSTAPATGNQTNVASSATDVTILAANAARKGAMIFNDSTSVLYLLLSTGTSSVTNYSTQILAGGILTMLVGEYTGVIKGLWSVANGAARVTEFS